MELAVYRLIFSIHHFEGVGPKPMHMPETIWGSPVGEEECDLVGGFRNQGNKIPERIRVLEMSGRIPFLCMNKTREQQSIPDEEYRGVVSY